MHRSVTITATTGWNTTPDGDYTELDDIYFMGCLHLESDPVETVSMLLDMLKIGGTLHLSNEIGKGGSGFEDQEDFERLAGSYISDGTWSAALSFQRPLYPFYLANLKKVESLERHNIRNAGQTDFAPEKARDRA